MNLINENRYEVTKQLFEKHNIDMPESDTKIYANVFEVIAYFVNNKLTDEEMFLAYDFLSDFLLNKKVEYNVFVSKEDRIRAQVRVMEEIPETAGKLTMKEKIGFAFCMDSAVCLQKYDEPSGTMKNGITLFDSIEHIENNLKWEQERRPEFFVIDKQEVKKKDDYGYSMSNPIQATSVHMGYEYLKHLIYNGEPIEYKRIGSTYFSGCAIDKYKIFKTKGFWIFKKEEHIAELYINPYSSSTPKIAPKGFELL